VVHVHHHLVQHGEEEEEQVDPEEGGEVESCVEAVGEGEGVGTRLLTVRDAPEDDHALEHEA